MKRYVECDIYTVGSTGNVQDGYLPILSYDAWRDQDHISATVHRCVCKASLSINIETNSGLTVGISEIRKLLSDMETNGIEFLIVHPNIDTNIDDYIGWVELRGDRWENLPKTQSEYMTEYRKYCFNVNRENRTRWEEYVNKNREIEIELANLEKLMAKHPEHVKKIMDGSGNGSFC
jgi:hypothetical protein